jgi:WD40 repeat protein
VVDASPPPSGVVTNSYYFTWAVTSGTLPGGLALAPDGTLSGTPTAAGQFAFTVTATDSAQPAGSGSKPFTVTIDKPAPLLIAPGQVPPAGVHGTPYEWTGFAFTATGGYLPLSWTVTAGTLPPGLTLNPDGTLTGTPMAASSTAFTVTVTDSSAPTPATNSVDYTISVSEPVPPTINNTPPPTATVGSPYSFQFSASDGLAPLVWTPPSAPMGGLAVSLDGILSGTPSTAGIFPIMLTVTDALNQSSPATPFTVRIAMARPAAAFVQTGSMSVARDGHAATLLQNGQVLITGGGSASAELYDPTTQAFTATTGSMMVARTGHSATLLDKSTLPNYGKVLVAGGGDQTAELYDPAVGTFTATTGTMVTLRLGQTATLLQDGQVLVAGGGSATAELFNPSTGNFTATGSMTVSRTGHTATLLADGRVLITGGMDASAELYDPASGTFTSTGSMSEGRSGHTATLLADGTVLVTGPDNTAELYSPGTGTFAVAGQRHAGLGATATLRSDGTVLVAGGRSGYRPVSTSTAELFAPESGGFVATGPLITARDGHTATLLADGSVLVTGGTKHTCVAGWYRGCRPTSLVLASAELFK